MFFLHADAICPSICPCIRPQPATIQTFPCVTHTKVKGRRGEGRGSWGPGILGAGMMTSSPLINRAPSQSDADYRDYCFRAKLVEMRLRGRHLLRPLCSECFIIVCLHEQAEELKSFYLVTCRTFDGTDGAALTDLIPLNITTH